jgi:hypothetical protein
MTPIDRADLLALLEPGPCMVEQLASWLEQPVDVVTAALVREQIPRCERCRQAFLPEPLTANRFCSRACYVSTPPKPRAPDANKGGRRPWADHEGRRAALIRALAAGPFTIGPLSHRVGLTREVTKDECRVLLKLGRVALVALNGVKAWALPGALRSTPAATSVRPRGPAGLLSDPRAPGASVSRGTIRSHGDRGQALRQPLDTPTVKPAPDWWETATPDGFSKLANQQLARMRESKEAKTRLRAVISAPLQLPR